MRQAREPFPFSPYKRNNELYWIPNKYNIQTVFKLPKKMAQILRNLKNQRPPFSSAGVYKIPCSCGKLYIGEIERMVNIRM